MAVNKSKHVTILKTDEQSFPYFDPSRLTNNKVNRLHKLTLCEYVN